MASSKLKPSDIKSLDGAKYSYPISPDMDKILKQDFEKIVHSPEFKVLGFLNGYMYTSEGNFLSKYTLEGQEIAKISIEISHASFYEGQKFFYAWFENVLYKISPNLDIYWSKAFDLNIKSATIDYRGDCFLLFESSRTIRKILSNMNDSVYIDGSDDPTKNVVIHDIFITKGGGWLYVLGTEYWDYDDKAKVFIDKYNTRTWEKSDHLELYQKNNVSINHPDYTFNELILSGDYYYLIGKSTLYKVNIKGLEFWKRFTGSVDEEYISLEYSDNTYDEFLHYAKINPSMNGYEFGKLQNTGKSIWYIRLTDSEEYADFNWAYYQTKLYTSTRAYVKPKRGYILSLNDDKVVFKTRDNHLVKILEYNYEEIYSPDNYYGVRLLADRIKDGIDKIVYHPLRHDDGDVINEDEDIILLPEENEHYTDAENYDYWYLLCSRYKIDPPDLSVIFTKNQQAVFTKLMNVIKTKKPVIPDRVYEYIINSEGKYIDTTKDLDLIRSRYKYSYDKYLLADLNMFSTDIITKKLGYTIITKKYGHDIIMKTRQIYSYVLTKYSDIDLIVEWLKENGVMDSDLPDYVEELKHHTLDAINDIQMAGTPQTYDVKAYKQFEYTYDGYKYPNNTWGTQIFSCTNLPWDKRRCVAKIYIDSLANCIMRQDMRPILFFLNGKVIPWSDCTIVRDWSYSYLLISNHDPFETELSSIIFPCDIRYGEDNNVLDKDQVNGYFYFDADGKSLNFSNRSKTSIRVEVIDKNVWGAPTTFTPIQVSASSTSKQAFEVKNKDNQKASEKNMIVFEDSLYKADARYYIRDYGKDIFTYERQLYDINTEFDLDIKAFYWIKANSYLGLENKAPNQELMNTKSAVRAVYDRTTLEDPLYTPFNFKMYRNRSYEDNIANAVAYIMKYDSSLLINYWKNMCQTKSYTFNGEYLINRVPKDGGWLILPRARKSKLDDYIMVFRNDHLYEFYKEIDYTDCYFKIPIFNHVERDDKIEVIHFKEVDNTYYTLTVTDDGTPDYLPENLRYDNFLLFGNSPSTENTYIPFDIETSIQYDIEYDYKNNFDERGKYKNTTIKLADDFYYGKEINMCSKRQFHYMYYNIFSAKSTVNLSPNFRFCHDKSKYLIFINGIRVNSEDWVLNVMSNEVKRKYISVTFNYDIPVDSLLEIFYLPVALQKVATVDRIKLSTEEENRGVVFSNLEELEIPFDKDLYFVDMSGYKVNYDDITNVSKDAFTVENVSKYLANSNPVNMTIFSLMRKDILLSKLYSYTDLWSNTISDINNSNFSELCRLLKKQAEI